MARHDVPHFTLRQLSYLMTAADEGTIRAAAKKLHISASAVSDSISELEQHLGIQLCTRKRARGLTLTSAGIKVVRQARDMLAEARELEVSLTAAAGELAGPITIGCYPTLAPTVLPPLLHGFGSRHPLVELQVHEATHDQLVSYIESGKIDIAFAYDTLIPGRVHCKRLFDLPAHVVLSPTDKMADQPFIRLEDMVDRDLIILDTQPSMHHTLSMFTARGLNPHIRHRTSNYEVVRTLVGRGLGYGILVQRPKSTVSYEGYPIIMKEIAPPVTPVGIDVVWSAMQEPVPRIRELIAYAHNIDWKG